MPLAPRPKTLKNTSDRAQSTVTGDCQRGTGQRIHAKADRISTPRLRLRHKSSMDPKHDESMCRTRHYTTRNSNPQNGPGASAGHNAVQCFSSDIAQLPNIVLHWISNTSSSQRREVIASLLLLQQLHMHTARPGPVQSHLRHYNAPQEITVNVSKRVCCFTARKYSCVRMCRRAKARLDAV